MYQVPEDLQLSKNFKLNEFACHDGSKSIMVNYRLIDGLQLLRDTTNKPISISSGYRTKAYNASCGGIDTSEHLTGSAADITISGMTLKQIARKAYDLGKFTGIGIYPTFVHLDVGAKPYYWSQDAKGKKTFYKSFAELDKAVK